MRNHGLEAIEILAGCGADNCSHEGMLVRNELADEVLGHGACLPTLTYIPASSCASVSRPNISTAARSSTALTPSPPAAFT